MHRTLAEDRHCLTEDLFAQLAHQLAECASCHVALLRIIGRESATQE